MWKPLLPLIAIAAPAFAHVPHVQTVDLAALDPHALHDGQRMVALRTLEENGWPLVARIMSRDGCEQEPSGATIWVAARERGAGGATDFMVIVPDASTLNRPLK
jgi:hypothetical protein